jgi:hypothetical protein
VFKKNYKIISNLNNLIIKNNLSFDYSFPFIIEKKYNELSFLNYEKISKNSKNKIQNIPNNIENISEKMQNDFDLLKNLKNKKKERIFKITKDYSKINNDNHFISRKKYRNNNYYSHLYKIQSNNSLFINKSNIKEKSLKKNINVKNNNIKENNLNKIDELSNSIKIKKNRKIIYINKFLFKPKNKNNDVVVKEKKRSSLYRGVSKNGKNWQVIISSNNSKGYIGNYKTQEIAARIYDIASIKKRGIKAKTNFKYDIHQIQNIIEEYIDYKSEDIEGILSNLIKKK